MRQHPAFRTTANAPCERSLRHTGKGARQWLASNLLLDGRQSRREGEDIVDGRIARRRRAADIMAITATKALVITKSRDEELKTMLEELRRELMLEVHAKIRDARTENGHAGSGFDEGEAADVDIQEEIGFTLIQMKTETLDKINTALRRIDEGTYGVCSECGDEIAGPRLRALPFALRCKDCEDTREMAERRERIGARGSSPSLFSELST